MKLFASIYIGSGEVILKIFEISKEKKLKEIDCLRSSTDIMKDIYKDGKVSLSTTETLCNTLSDMKKTFLSYKVDDYRAYAGHTLASASNDRFVLEQILLKTGIDVTLLSNSEHRFLGYEAIASIPSFDEMIEEDVVIVDVGGVNLQITLFHKSKIVTTQHLHLGTYSTKASIQKLAEARDYKEQISALIDKELDTFVKVYMKDIRPTYLIMIGDRVLKKAIESKNIVNDENRIVYEPLILLHKEIVKMIDAKKVIVPDVSISDGIALHYAYNNKLLKAEHNFDDDILSAAWSIARRYNSYEPHLKALEKLSVQIFDSTKKYHSMGKRERLLMRVVCILHDCGKYISLSNTSECTYTIIKQSEILGLTHKEREIVAVVAALNRRDLLSYSELADRFTQEEYWVMVQLLAILKVANAMDRSHKQKFKNVQMSVKDKKLDILIEANSSISLEKGLFKEKADFFEEVFAIRPVIREKRVLS